MKRIISVIMIVLLTVCVSACNKSQKIADEKATETVTQIPSEEPTKVVTKDSSEDEEYRVTFSIVPEGESKEIGKLLVTVIGAENENGFIVYRVKRI